MVVTSPVTQTPTMAEVVLGRSLQPTAYPLGKEQGLGVMDRATKGLAQGGKAQLIGRTHILSNASGATWPGNALPLQWF